MVALLQWKSGSDSDNSSVDFDKEELKHDQGSGSTLIPLREMLSSQKMTNLLGVLFLKVQSSN